jgi:hypothetical protein
MTTPRKVPKPTTPPPPATPPKPLTTPPRTPTPLDVAWEALAADIHANGYSVRDAIARHRPPIETEARAAPDPAPLDVERLARALQRVIDNGDALALFREDAAAITAEYTREDKPPPPAEPTLDVERLEELPPYRYIRHAATCLLNAVRDNPPDDDSCTCGLREWWLAHQPDPFGEDRPLLDALLGALDRDRGAASVADDIRAEARAPLDEPPRIVTLAWDATAEDVARIRRDWEAAAEARAPLDVERVARIFHDRLDQSVLGHAGPVCQPCRQNAKDFAREYAKEPQP